MYTRPPSKAVTTVNLVCLAIFVCFNSFIILTDKSISNDILKSFYIMQIVFASFITQFKEEFREVHSSQRSLTILPYDYWCSSGHTD